MKISIFKNNNNIPKRVQAKIKYDPLFITIGFLLVLIVWEVSSIINKNLFLPGILDTLKSFFNLFKEGSTYKVLLYTLLRLLISLGISFVLGILLSVLAFYKRWIKNILTPFISICKSVPIASIIIIMLIFVGHANAPYLITIIMTLPLVYEGVYNGLEGIDKNIYDEIKMQTNLNSRVIFEVYLPMIRSSIIMSALQAFGIGVKSMVMSEFITQPTYSIGRALLDAKNNIEYSEVFAWTLILIVIVFIFDYSINKIKRSID